MTTLQRRDRPAPTKPPHITPEQSAVPIDQRRHAERAVLGAMLRDRLCIPDVVRVLRHESMMYFNAHQIIFRAIIDLHSDAKPIDSICVVNSLYERKQLDDAGKYTYIQELLEGSPTSANAEYHAKIVLNHHLLAQSAYLGDELGREARAPVGPANEMLSEYDRRIMKLVEDATTNEPVTLAVALEEQMAIIDARASRSEEAGIPTQFRDLDKIIIGLQPSELTAIAARPSVGKTALGACIARNLVAANKRVLFVSLEQSRNEICERLLAHEAMVDSYHIRAGRIKATDAEAMLRANAVMKKWNLHIDDSPNQTVTTITANARLIHRRHGLDAVFVDYLQLITADNPKANRYEQVGAISKRLKQLARDLKIPVVAMCQVGRDAGDGDAESPPPKLHQLRESGNIEQDLDVAILLHRAERGDILAGKPEMIRVDVAKNRNGRRGLMMLAYRPQFLKFESVMDGF